MSTAKWEKVGKEARKCGQIADEREGSLRQATREHLLEGGRGRHLADAVVLIDVCQEQVRAVLGPVLCFVRKTLCMELHRLEPILLLHSMPGLPFKNDTSITRSQPLSWCHLVSPPACQSNPLQHERQQKAIAL